MKKDLSSSTSVRAISRRARAPLPIRADGTPHDRVTRRRARSRGVAYVTLPHVERPEYARPKRGETIRAFVDRTGWEARGLAMLAVEVDHAGVPQPILRKDWGRKIKSADQLCFVARPAGGGGGSRSIGAIIALIALMVIANVVAGPIAGAIAGATGITVAASTVAAVIVAGGSLLISAFLAPKSGAKTDGESTFTASLSGNKARPQQPIPVHYGRLKFTPDFAAQPWGDFQDEDQVFYGLYSLGMGEFDIHEIGVADTPIWTAASGTSAGFPNFQHEIVAPNSPVTLFPINVVSATEVSGIELPDPYTAAIPGPLGQTSGTNFVGPFIINPAGTSGTEVSIDLVWPGGCYASNKEGKIGAVGSQFIAEYRYVDAAGVPIGGVGAAYTTLIDQTGSNQFVFRSLKPVRRTLNVTLPTAGRIQVRVGIPTAARRQNGTNVLYWQGARMFLGGSQQRPKVTQLAVRILADQQFSGYARQQLYVIATRKLPVWTGTSWVTQATRNPLWAFADLWTNADYGCGRSLSKMDLATVAAEAADAATRGDTFNHRFTEILSCMEALEAVLRPIAAKPLFVGGNLSLVRDKARTIPNIMLTDLSVVRGSVSVEYPLQTDDESDGVIIEYLEEQIWQPAEVSSSGTVASLLRPARVQIPGLTNRSQATRLARYLALTNANRRRIVALDVEAEGRLLQMGSLVCVSASLMALGGQTLRVASFTVPGVGGPRLVADAAMPAPVWVSGQQHFVRIRRRNGRPFGPVLCTRGASDNEIVLDSTNLASVETAQGVTFASVMLRDAAEELVQLSFSPTAPKEFLGLVTSLRVMGDGQFRLTLIEYSDTVYDVSGSIPALPTAQLLVTPPTPGQPGSLFATMQQVGMIMTLSATWRPDTGSTRYVAQITQDGGSSWQDVYSGPSPGFNLQGIAAVETIVRVRGERASENGIISGLWAESGEVIPPALDLTPANIGYVIGSQDIASPLFDRIWQGQAETDGNAVAQVLAAEILRQEDGRAGNASVVRETIARETADGSLAAQITTVEAKSDAGTATGRIRFVAASSVGAGVAAAFDIEVRSAIDTGAFSSAGLRLEALNDGSSRIILTADQLFVQDATTRKLPFAVSGGELYLAGSRFLDFVRSDAVDAAGNPLWIINNNGNAEFRNAKISGEMGAVDIGVGETFRLKRGAKILDGQWPPYDIRLTPITALFTNGFAVSQDSITSFSALGPYYFTDERVLSEPFCFDGTATATASWLMPDGVIRTTANIDTDVTGSSPATGFIPGLDWNPGLINISYPYKIFCPAIGYDKDFLVPDGCTKISFKGWGGGGGTSSNINAAAGACGYVEGIIPVTPGDKIRVQVGAGGAGGGVMTWASNSDTWNRGYAGAGKSRFLTFQRASGGGRTALFKVNPDNSLTPLFIAAGGGSSEIAGGLPGGPDGLYSSYHSDWAGGGIGEPTTVNSQGGGGGGWRGGVRGQGGANYVHPSATSTQNLAGTGPTPPNTSDPDYTTFTSRTNANYAPGRAFGLNSRSTIIHTRISTTNGRFGNGGLAVLELLNT